MPRETSIARIPYQLNSLSKSFSSNTKVFIDDTCIYSTLEKFIVSTNQMSSD